MIQTLSELDPEDAFRFEIISKTLSDPTWTAERAAEVLHLTMRQVFRLKAKVQRLGSVGVVHGSRAVTRSMLCRLRCANGSDASMSGTSPVKTGTMMHSPKP